MLLEQGGSPVPRFFHPQVSSIDFSANSITGNAPFTVQFTNISSQDALNFYNWTWNFNDGQAGSNERDPSHTFLNTGSYSVSVTGSSQADATVISQSIKVNYISASLPVPSINFSPLTTTGSIPLSVAFTNLSNAIGATGSIYKWTFSGSTNPVTPVTTSNDLNPTITFYNTGSYAVKLEATGSWNLSGSIYKLLSVNAIT